MPSREYSPAVMPAPTKSPTRKPDWLKVRFSAGPGYARIERYHREQGLHSVCRSAACPNQGECWSAGVATFMILGDRCTRDCAFCNVTGGIPFPPDPEEPEKVARAIAELGLRHAVVTSVTRDDLTDGGASQFASLTKAIRRQAPECTIELLIPDLGGNYASLATVLSAAPDVLGHNIETVPRLYSAVRSGASYRRSLEILAQARASAPQLPLKSGLMLGMGEMREEVLTAMTDLLQAGCTLLTLGQYLQPTNCHHPVIRFIPPEEFTLWRSEAMAMGFDHVEAGPLVRSSYHAAEQFEEARHGRE